jgi:hypothetical protein
MAKPDLRPVFERLKEIFAPHEPKMIVAQNTDTTYILNTQYLLKKKYPLMFGGVRLGKNYVSYHLMSIYAMPAQLQTMSPELKKRMQGKGCFNFKAVDEKLFKELAKITKEGAKRFNRKFIEDLEQSRSEQAKTRKENRG